MSTSDKEAAADPQKRGGLLSPPKISTKNEEHQGKLRVLSELFGQELVQWDFSEETLAAMLALRTEQERSRQLEVKNHTLQLSLELIALARSTGIPPHSIPMLFPSHMDETTREALETARAEFEAYPQPRSQSISQQQPPVPPLQQRFEFHHWPGPPEEEDQAKRRHTSNRRNSIHHRTYSDYPAQQQQQIPPPAHLQQQYRYQYSPVGPQYAPQPVQYPHPPPPPQPYPYAIPGPQRRGSWDSPKREGPLVWVPPPQAQEQNSPSTLTPSRSAKQNVSFMISTPHNPPK